MPGGTYYRTYTNSGDGGTGEADLASVSGFRLDKYLVTVGRFRQFVNAWSNGYLPAAGSGKHVHLNGGSGLVSAGALGADGGVVYESGWDSTDWNNTSDVDPTTANLTSTSCGGVATWTASFGNQENLPIVCVSWFEAYAFCIWDGGFLPSSAESEYAAAGGNQQLEYPWGSAAPGAANEYAIYDCNYPSQENCTNGPNVAPVGTTALGPGYWGQLDLTGEVSEFVLDWYTTSYPDPCADCAYLTVTPYRMDRGGSYMASATSLLSTYFDGFPPSLGSDAIGFRCARTP
ncbi:MAG TPA: SUMF1/EgtB/PvdO family nonheme iron enzyme [bacterium]|nr:SUMF1/EgtB/PvdO family nonheme iron enzyme [bacterium]